MRTVAIQADSRDVSARNYVDVVVDGLLKEALDVLRTRKLLLEIMEPEA
jgi:hypothetical protein